jgi:Chromate transporter
MPTLGAIARAWGRIGITGFGGPPAHNALLRELVVDRTRWMGAGQFEDGLAACNLLPGPALAHRDNLAARLAWGFARASITGARHKTRTTRHRTPPNRGFGAGPGRVAAWAVKSTRAVQLEDHGKRDSARTGDMAPAGVEPAHADSKAAGRSACLQGKVHRCEAARHCARHSRVSCANDGAHSGRPTSS